ncbi:aromatic ring-hydroxylating dioxygenase subunit alpha [Acidisoma cellulosilytica]|uniref:Aromatic ring-hydroxylating dioxygenase subunit alpha n=1 Tax=Acidisoma cellulosilyticum TaxID=2802395 RepID=A0A963Z683_9PROT|nr:aromatic ring-hydroxylating dioxygenase subunit alpha [Acidisoma cellulosilyticum]MCB8883378.1 aromatic ring-hydroxylating dioxygenase subunit alpha [Acidisoma cellulosilyticum]
MDKHLSASPQAHSQARSHAEPPLEQLVAEVMAGSGQSLADSETLPPAVYTSQAFYDLEVEKIFKPEWVCIGHVSMLSKPGDYVSLDLFGEMLVVTHAADGLVRVLSRVCLHRWAPIVEGSGNAKILSCPFHRWGYSLDGKLTAAPHMEQAAGFDKAECQLPEYKSEIVGGFIFVNLDGQAPPLAPRLAEMTDSLARYRTDELHVAHTLTYDCAFNWKIVAETFMEPYHHIGPHLKSFERDFPGRLGFIEDGRKDWTICHCVARPELGQAAYHFGFPMLPDLTDAEKGDFRCYLAYPYHLLSVHPDRIIWFCLRPLGPARTILDCHVMIRAETFDTPGFREEFDRQMVSLHEVNLEDVGVNDMQQRGATTGAARIGRLSHLEKAVWQIADYVRGRIGS